jgi:choline-sulfatase
VRWTDDQMKRLLDFVEAQPWGKKTAIIVTSDHGEAFGEHGMYGHGFEVWEEIVRVPDMPPGPFNEARRAYIRGDMKLIVAGGVR